MHIVFFRKREESVKGYTDKINEHVKKIKELELALTEATKVEEPKMNAFQSKR